MLNDFFRINLPYGIARNDKGEWMAFNREYMPLGYNNSNYRLADFPNSKCFDLPIYTKYKGLTERVLIKIAARNSAAIKRNEKGEIIAVWLYHDETNPLTISSINTPLWQAYCEKLKILANLRIR